MSTMYSAAARRANERTWFRFCARGVLRGSSVADGRRTVAVSRYDPLFRGLIRARHRRTVATLRSVARFSEDVIIIEGSLRAILYEDFAIDRKVHRSILLRDSHRGKGGLRPTLRLIYSCIDASETILDFSYLKLPLCVFVSPISILRSSIENNLRSGSLTQEK